MVKNFYVKKNDDYPYYRIIVNDKSGALDLSGSTVLFTMQDLSSGTNKITSQSASLIGGTTGGVEYQWQAGDTDTTGTYGIQFEVTLSSGKKFTVPKGFTAKVIIEDEYE